MPESLVEDLEAKRSSEETLSSARSSRLSSEAELGLERASAVAARRFLLRHELLKRLSECCLQVAFLQAGHSKGIKRASQGCVVLAPWAEELQPLLEEATDLTQELRGKRLVLPSASSALPVVGRR